ncbi:MAG: GNAT family N-acetyltransferase [Chloroflexota bacterium]|nr:GNAT family N-acetyltransferase [Chloroflexota bacterium]
MTPLIRAARTPDLPAVFDLLAACFPEASRELFVAQTERDSTFRLRHGRVALLDGRVAGYVRIFARTMLVRGVHAPAGGIGSVATHPDARGAGIATALMRDAIAEMRREGMRVSYLFTGIPEFYERLGYGIVGQPSFDVDPREAASAPNSGLHDVRAIDESEIPQLLAIYERAVAIRTGAVVRTKRTWRDAARWLSEDSGGCFVAERDGLRVGYIRSRCRERGHQILEAECLLGHEGAIGALLAAVAGRAVEHREAIYALVPDDHSLAAALRLLPSTRESALPTHPMMVRALVDDPRLDAAFGGEPMHYWNSDRI